LNGPTFISATAPNTVSPPGSAGSVGNVPGFAEAQICFAVERGVILPVLIALLKAGSGSFAMAVKELTARQIGAWARKCFESSQRGALVVLLVTARTDTRWFHDWVQGKAKVEFIRGRLKFGKADNSAPFSSMLAVYTPNRPATTCARCGNGFVARSDARACSNACRQALYRSRNVTAQV
jgi:hypothetical protein